MAALAVQAAVDASVITLVDVDAGVEFGPAGFDFSSSPAMLVTRVSLPRTDGGGVGLPFARLHSADGGVDFLSLASRVFDSPGAEPWAWVVTPTFSPTAASPALAPWPYRTSAAPPQAAARTGCSVFSPALAAWWRPSPSWRAALVLPPSTKC